MGKAGRHIRFKLHLFQDPGNEFSSFCSGAYFMHFQALADDLFYRQPGRQGGKGILEDNLQLLAQGPHSGAAERGEIDNGFSPVVQDFALTGDQPKNAQGQGTFAGTGFANHAQGGALGNLQADTVHGLEDIFFAPGKQPLAPGQGKTALNILQFEQGGAARARCVCGIGQGGEQVAGVRIPRVPENLCHRTLLDNTPLVHDGNRIGNSFDHGQVMGDQQDAHLVFSLNVHEQVQDLALNGDIKGGGRLIGNQQLWPAGQGHGNHDPLPLAAGELMRVGVHPVFRFPDAAAAEQPQPLVPCLVPGHLAMQKQWFQQLVTDGIHRIERGHGLLKDHGNIIAPDMAYLVHGELENVAAVKLDPAADRDAAGLFKKTEDGHGGYGFARAGFSDQGMGPAGIYLQGNPAQHLLCPVRFLVGEKGKAKPVKGE